MFIQKDNTKQIITYMRNKMKKRKNSSLDNNDQSDKLIGRSKKIKSNNNTKFDKQTNAKYNSFVQRKMNKFYSDVIRNQNRASIVSLLGKDILKDLIKDIPLIYAWKLLFVEGWDEIFLETLPTFDYKSSLPFLQGDLLVKKYQHDSDKNYFFSTITPKTSVSYTLGKNAPRAYVLEHVFIKTNNGVSKNLLILLYSGQSQFLYTNNNLYVDYYENEILENTKKESILSKLREMVFFNSTCSFMSLGIYDDWRLHSSSQIQFLSPIKPIYVPSSASEQKTKEKQSVVSISDNSDEEKNNFADEGFPPIQPDLSTTERLDQETLELWDKKNKETDKLYYLILMNNQILVLKAVKRFKIDTISKKNFIYYFEHSSFSKPFEYVLEVSSPLYTKQQAEKQKTRLLELKPGTEIVWKNDINNAWLYAPEILTVRGKSLFVKDIYNDKFMPNFVDMNMIPKTETDWLLKVSFVNANRKDHYPQYLFPDLIYKMKSSEKISVLPSSIRNPSFPIFLDLFAVLYIRGFPIFKLIDMRKTFKGKDNILIFQDATNSKNCVYLYENDDAVKISFFPTQEAAKTWKTKFLENSANSLQHFKPGDFILVHPNPTINYIGTKKAFTKNEQMMKSLQKHSKWVQVVKVVYTETHFGGIEKNIDDFEQSMFSNEKEDFQNLLLEQSTDIISKSLDRLSSFAEEDEQYMELYKETLQNIYPSLDPTTKNHNVETSNKHKFPLLREGFRKFFISPTFYVTNSSILCAMSFPNNMKTIQLSKLNKSIILNVGDKLAECKIRFEQKKHTLNNCIVSRILDCNHFVLNDEVLVSTQDSLTCYYITNVVP